MSSERFYVVQTHGFLERGSGHLGGHKPLAQDSASVLDRAIIHRCIQTFRSEDYPPGLQTKRRCAAAIRDAEALAARLNDGS